MNVIYVKRMYNFSLFVDIDNNSAFISTHCPVAYVIQVPRDMYTRTWHVKRLEAYFSLVEMSGNSAQNR